MTRKRRRSHSRPSPRPRPPPRPSPCKGEGEDGDGRGPFMLLPPGQGGGREGGRVRRGPCASRASRRAELAPPRCANRAIPVRRAEAVRSMPREPDSGKGACLLRVVTMVEVARFRRRYASRRQWHRNGCRCSIPRGCADGRAPRPRRRSPVWDYPTASIPAGWRRRHPPSPR